jgi:hypothetical protein
MAVAIPQQLKLIIAIVGIFGSFSYFAVLQEDLFKKSYAVRNWPICTSFGARATLFAHESDVYVLCDTEVT